MTEKEKMEKGELYDAVIPELIEQLLSTRDKIFELNHLRPSQLEEREKLIREIIGTTPEKFIIISPFFCDYGHNIHLGKKFLCQLQLRYARRGSHHHRRQRVHRPQRELLYGRSPLRCRATKRMARIRMAYYGRE